MFFFLDEWWEGGREFELIDNLCMYGSFGGGDDGSNIHFISSRLGV